MGVGGIPAKNSESHHKADRSGVLSGHPNTGPAHVGRPAGLKARISIVPLQSVTRGETVRLSAKHSTGFIKDYHWSFTYADGADNDTMLPGGAGEPVPSLQVCRKEGVEISVLVLRSLHVTLTVTDSENSSESDDAVIEVSPRHWKTKFTSHPQVKPMPGIFSHEAGGFRFGLNNCTLEGDPIDEGAGHILHPTRSTIVGDVNEPSPADIFGYEGAKLGFTVDQVHDPGGPFHEFWYVASYNVIVDRTLFMNRRLLPGGDLNQINHDVKKYSHDMDTLVKCVSIHEQIHSDLIKEQLQDVDPAGKLEKYVLKDRDDLRAMAHQACVQANSSLLEDHCHELEVHKRLRGRGFSHGGTIMLGDGAEYKITSFANLGDSDD